MQIRVVEHNDWEGETFCYVLEVSEEAGINFEKVIDKLEPSEWEVYPNTNYTTEKVQELNDMVSNDYMDYIGFYELKEEPQFTERWVVDTFYKGNGLKRLD